MSFLTTTLTPASGYTYVHAGQVYAMIADQLTAHTSGSWEYVEYVDYVSGANTTRTHVWRCKSSGSGLSADFYVLFTLRFTTSGTVYQTSYSTDAMTISVCEQYNPTTKVASKYAPIANSGTAVTIDSDGAHPGTWTLNTLRPNASTGAVAYSYQGPISASTSHRFVVAVTKDLLMVGQPGLSTWAGAFETILGPTLDPLPVGMAVQGVASYSSFSTANSVGHVIATTRHPGMSGSLTHRFGFSYASIYQTTASMDVRSFNILTPIHVGSGGTLGSEADTSWSYWNGGVITGKICVSACGTGTGSVKGVHRGYVKYFLTAPNLATHAFGDTFLVDGKSYLGFGSSQMGIWDTTA